MDGFELVAEVRKKEPKMPVLNVSGYSGDKSSEVAEQDSEACFLAKPYDRRALAVAVRGALAMR
jgi:DNA-binding NtrC family response regulator